MAPGRNPGIAGLPVPWRPLRLPRLGFRGRRRRKEGEGAEAWLEATRRPAPVVDPLDVLVSDAAVRAKDGGEEREVERHGEPVVTPLTLALAPEEGAPKGEGAEKPDAGDQASPSS